MKWFLRKINMKEQMIENEAFKLAAEDEEGSTEAVEEVSRPNEL